MLSVEVGTKVLDLVAGVKTYSLPGGFGTPKALIVWATHQIANGNNSTAPLFIYGFATADDGAEQAAYNQFYVDPSNTASRIVRFGAFASGANPTLLKTNVLSDSVTVNWEVTFDGFGTDEWRIDLIDPPTTDGIRFHYIVLGGSDIEVARAGSFSLATSGAAQDVTVRSGFGQPDLLHFMSMNRNGDVSAGELVGNLHLMLGWAISATERRAQVMFDQDAAGTMVTASQQTDKAAVGLTSTPAADWDFDLGARAGWPTDGFELDVTDLPAAATTVYYLALKGTFQKKIAAQTTRTTTGDQDLDAGFTPKLGLTWGHVMPAGTGIQRSAESTDATGMWVGATDGTNQHIGALSQDDGATASDGFSYNEDLTLDAISEATTVRASATGSFTGNNVRLTYGVVDATPRQFSWLALGDAAVATVPRIISYVG